VPDPDAERVALEAANAAFYTAFETGDLDAMRALWLDAPDTVCIHPGALPVRGAGAVHRSWALVMANTSYIQFFLTDVEVSLRADVATVTCTENVLTGDDRNSPDVFGGAMALATQVFVRTPEGWRLWVRHAAPVLSEEGDHDA
jgi:ketosteroid isomerase-like protein